MVIYTQTIKLRKGAYEHNLLAYERDIRECKFAPGCKCERIYEYAPGCKYERILTRHKGAILHPGVNMNAT